MTDYISREAAIRRCVPMDFDSKMAISERELMKLPAADVRPVVHGKWITQEYMYGDPDVGTEDMWVERLAEYGDCAYCSECGGYAGLDGSEEYVLSNYCPHCGAKMENALKK